MNIIYNLFNPPSHEYNLFNPPSHEYNLFNPPPQSNLLHMIHQSNCQIQSQPECHTPPIQYSQHSTKTNYNYQIDTQCTQLQSSRLNTYLQPLKPIINNYIYNVFSDFSNIFGNPPFTEKDQLNFINDYDNMNREIYDNIGCDGCIV